MAPREKQTKFTAQQTDFTAHYPTVEAVEDVFLDDEDVEQTHLFEDPRGTDALNMVDVNNVSVNAWQFFNRHNLAARRRRTNSTPVEIGWLTSGYTTEQRADSIMLTVYHKLLRNDTELAEFEQTLGDLFNQMMSS